LPLAPFADKNVSVSIHGAGPYQKDDFADLLDLGFLDIDNLSGKTEVLIIGQEGWDQNELINLLKEREGRPLRVYSQEMFLGYWLTGRDPIIDEDVARAFGVGHPALEFLSSAGFDWPKMEYNLRVNRELTGNLVAEGLLR
jgi:hypothetical protein